MMEPFIGSGALLLVLVVVAWRSVLRRRPRAFDLGVVSDQWKAQLWLRRDDPARDR
jgi:hypothetical protein